MLSTVLVYRRFGVRGKKRRQMEVSLRFTRIINESEYHIRYGGYGGIAYHHVSDKYIAFCGFCGGSPG